MPKENRDVTWRQGDVFIVPEKGAHPELHGVVASHDCDICADDETEPFIEVLKIDLGLPENGNLTLGKNPRRLQAEISVDGADAVVIELDIRNRQLLPKAEFFGESQKYTKQLDRRGVQVLQRWLASRYGRSAFPNAFEERMTRKVLGKIDRLSSKCGKGIRGLYFDLDENKMIERTDCDDPYELAIYVVYPTDTDDGDAESFAQELGRIFKDEFFDNATGDWRDIHLLSCDPISEDVFPLALANSTKSWRVDHRSLDGLPVPFVCPEPYR